MANEFKAAFTEFRLRADFIELDNLLKALKIVASGAEAKQHIQAGSVKINGQVETHTRRKLRQADSVEFGEYHIRIIS